MALFRGLKKSGEDFKILQQEQAKNMGHCIPYQAFHGLLLVLKEVLVDFVLGRRDLILEHDIPKHEEGKNIAEAQNPPGLK